VSQCSDTDVSQRAYLLREAALGLSMAMKEDAKSISFVEDTAVAPEKLSAYIGRFLQIVRDHGTTAGVYAHASVGCLHVRPVVNMKTEEGVANSRASPRPWRTWCWNSAERCLASMAMAWFVGRSCARCSATRCTKRFARSSGLSIQTDLQPRQDCRLTATHFESSLRRGIPHAESDHVVRLFDFGGFGGAVEMCSGVGACRKKLSGTMCPSYMATRDEKDSTRGRPTRFGSR